MNIGGGTTVVASSVTVEVASGGTASIAAGPAAATGAGMIAKGVLEVGLGKIIIAHGGDNFKNQKGRVSEDGNNKPTRNERATEKKAKKVVIQIMEAAPSIQTELEVLQNNSKKRVEQEIKEIRGRKSR